MQIARKGLGEGGGQTANGQRENGRKAREKGLTDNWLDSEPRPRGSTNGGRAGTENENEKMTDSLTEDSRRQQKKKKEIRLVVGLTSYESAVTGGMASEWKWKCGNWELDLCLLTAFNSALFFCEEGKSSAESNLWPIALIRIAKTM
jgi:hypothetical protein